MENYQKGNFVVYYEKKSFCLHHIQTGWRRIWPVAPCDILNHLPPLRRLCWGNGYNKISPSYKDPEQGTEDWSIVCKDASLGEKLQDVSKIKLEIY